MELGFHAVCVKVNVRIHGLNVHLIGVAAQTIIFGIVTTGIFNQGFLEHIQNGLVVLGIDFHRQGGNITIITNLHGSESGKVAAELTKIFTIVILQNQDGIPCVLLHIVFKVGNHGVDSVLKGFHTANQGDFLFVIFERNQGNPFPIQFGGFLAFFLNGEVAFMFPGFHIRLQFASIIDIPVKAIGLEQFNPFNDFLGISIPHFLRVKTDSRIKDGVIIVSPKRKNFIGREMFEGQIALFVIEWEQPAKATIQGIFTNILQKPVEPLIEHIVQSVRIGFVLTVHREGLAHKVVGFLIHHQGILVINQAVVRKIVHFLKFAISTNDCALPVQNVMTAFIVVSAFNLIHALQAVLPFTDFSGVKLKFSHAVSPTLKDQAVDTLHSVIQKHIQSPFPFTIGGGAKPTGLFRVFSKTKD